MLGRVICSLLSLARDLESLEYLFGAVGRQRQEESKLEHDERGVVGDCW